MASKTSWILYLNNERLIFENVKNMKQTFLIAHKIILNALKKTKLNLMKQFTVT